MRRVGVTAAAALALALAPLAAGCSRDTGSTEAFCEQVRRVPTIETVVQGFADADPEELQERLDAASAAYDTLHDRSPDEIRGDVGEVSSLVTVITSAVGDHPDDPEAVKAEIRRAMDDHDDASAAAKKVAVYAKKECDVDLNPVVE